MRVSSREKFRTGYKQNQDMRPQAKAFVYSLALMALLTGCASPDSGSTAKIGPQSQVMMVTNGDTGTQNLMKMDAGKVFREEWAQQSFKELDGEFTTVITIPSDPLIEIDSSEPMASGFDGDLPAPPRFKVSSYLMARLALSQKPAAKVELMETYPNVPASQSTLVNAINQPGKIVLK